MHHQLQYRSEDFSALDIPFYGHEKELCERCFIDVVMEKLFGYNGKRCAICKLVTALIGRGGELCICPWGCLLFILILILLIVLLIFFILWLVFKDDEDEEEQEQSDENPDSPAEISENTTEQSNDSDDSAQS